MNIAILDGFVLNPGDLSWDDLKTVGNCRIYDRTLPTEVVERSAGAEIVLLNKTVLARDHINKLPHLKYVGVLATGTNVVDLLAARERGIPVTNVPAYGTRSVAQGTIALLLELTQHVGHHADGVRAGRWTASRDWCYWDYPLIELEGHTMGIIGYGHVGQAVSRLASAFGMAVLASSPSPKPTSEVRFVELETLFRQSDVVTLHCPLAPETHQLVNAQRLAWMKPTAFLLNTGRGPLVDEDALAEALNAGRLAGAGLDVLSVEPPKASNPLLQAKNCLITPHLTWATRAARQRLMKIAAENIRAYLRGHVQNVVNR